MTNRELLDDLDILSGVEGRMVADTPKPLWRRRVFGLMSGSASRVFAISVHLLGQFSGLAHHRGMDKP